MSIVESYRITERIGGQNKRKFGQLFIVEHKEDKSKAVLKALQKNDSNAHIADRLRNEAQFTFEHSSLPKVLAFEESDAEVLLVRSHVEGVTIDQYWKKLKRKERLPFILKVLEKLQPVFGELKQQGIVHADIKPGNILISGSQDIEVFLIDFGLSLKKNTPEDRDILFPLGFAAPELLLNELDLVDQRTDFFALGILIWRLYANALPLTHPNPSIFTNLQLTHPLPEHSDVPKAVYRILLKMAHKHQFKMPPNRMKKEEVRTLLAQAMKDRYGQIEEIIEDFKQIQSKGSFGFLPKKIFSKS